MPAATLGPDNPLPSLGGCLPYRIQNRYDRNRKKRKFKTAVLENEILRATFLLELGGRLWSLIHKPSGRELLYRNPVFQPGALAMCNAWFSGGVEWNCCTGGHTPLTCSPLFAARVAGPRGVPVLRLYEYERSLNVPYQLDFLLPAKSPWLFVRARLTNPNDKPVKMYWWSNIAVPETPDLRVIAPANGALKSNYTDSINRIPMPYDGVGRDSSYPVNSSGSADFFWDIPETQRKWEAALDGEGKGLIHVSTQALRGRKLFVWGMSPGGRHWQEFLSIPGHPYIEIQGGLMPTQGDKLLMQPGSNVSWIEAYGLMEADPKRVHGADWNSAWRDIDERLAQQLPAERLDQLLKDTAPLAKRAPEQVIFRGRGWGALENERRARAGELPMCSKALVFDKTSMGPDQAPWLKLLQTGSLPKSDEPVSWMTQVEWRTILEKSPGHHWLKDLHLGIMYFQAGDIEGAINAWKHSLTLQPSAWAWRNLAVAARVGKHIGEAADFWLAAYRMMPGLLPMAVECCVALIAAGRPGEMLSLANRMPKAIKENGRMLVLMARAALDAGQLDSAEKILLSKDLVMPDLWEGELLLSDTWYGLQEQKMARQSGVAVDDAIRARVRRECPPPSHLEFRMAAAK